MLYRGSTVGLTNKLWTGNFSNLMIGPILKTFFLTSLQFFIKQINFKLKCTPYTKFINF